IIGNMQDKLAGSTARATGAFTRSASYRYLNRAGLTVWTAARRSLGHRPLSRWRLSRTAGCKGFTGLLDNPLRLFRALSGIGCALRCIVDRCQRLLRVIARLLKFPLQLIHLR